MIIEELKIEDIDSVCDLMFVLYQKWDEMDPIDKIDQSWFGSAEHRKYIKEIIENRNRKIFLAKEDSEVLGYTLAKIEIRKPFLRKVGDIAETFITTNHRGKGIASDLLNKCKEWFLEEGISWITVSTHSQDSEACEFWQKKGFCEFNKYYKMQL